MRSSPRALLWLSMVCSSSAHGAAPLLVQPSFPSSGFSAAGESVLSAGRAGISIHALAGSARNGGSRVAATGILPLGTSTDARSSGWFVSAGVGYRPQLWRDDFIVPSAATWEVSAGRAISFLEGAGETGLRGYLDLGVREDQLLLSDEIRAFYQAHQYDPKTRIPLIGLRVGASNDPAGSGLVAQSAPKFAVLIQSAAYYPVVGQGIVLFGSARGLWPMGWPWLRVGGFVNATKYLRPDSYPDFETLSSAFNYGGEAHFRLASDYLVQTQVGWTLALTEGHARAAALPFFKTTLSYLF